MAAGTPAKPGKARRTRNQSIAYQQSNRRDRRSLSTKHCLQSLPESASNLEPDMKISRIRLSDKTSRLHPWHVVPKPAQAHEPEVPVKVREWIRPCGGDATHTFHARDINWADRRLVEGRR
jgi:hypothetical protein